MQVRARAVPGQRYLGAKGLLPIDICVFILFLKNNSYSKLLNLLYIR
jgi:hypothetical protein